MELIEIERVDFNNNNLTAVFDGLFKEGFYVETEFAYDEYQLNYADERTGEKDYYYAGNISFWDFEVFNTDEELISINERELKKIKELVEFKLTDLLEDNINNN